MTDSFRTAPTLHHRTILGRSTAWPQTIRTSSECWESAISFDRTVDRHSTTTTRCSAYE